MPKRILVMGLPGSGKTYFAERLKTCFQSNKISVDWINADVVRKQYNDWDFSREGRIRQAIRMRQLADKSSLSYVIADFIAPSPMVRDYFNADYTIWMDTVIDSQYDDTNKAFVPPDTGDFRITEKNAEKWVPIITAFILAKQYRREMEQLFGVELDALTK